MTRTPSLGQRIAARRRACGLSQAELARSAEPQTEGPASILGDWLRAELHRTGLTRVELAERAGITRKTLYHLEHGTLKRGTTTSTVAAVRDALRGRDDG